jgi:hypothetical protein
MIGITRYVEAFVLNTYAGQDFGRNQIELIDFDEHRVIKLIAGKINVDLNEYTPHLVTPTRLKIIGRDYELKNKDTVVFIHDELELCDADCKGINFCDKKVLEIYNDAKDSFNYVGRFRLVMPSRDSNFRGNVFEDC